MIIIGRGWTYSGRFIPARRDAPPPLPYRRDVRRPGVTLDDVQPDDNPDPE